MAAEEGVTAMERPGPYPGFLQTSWGGSLHPHHVGNHRYCGPDESNCDLWNAAKRAGLPAPPYSDEKAARRKWVRTVRDPYLAERGLTLAGWIDEERRLRAGEFVAAQPEMWRESARESVAHDERTYAEWLANGWVTR